MKDISFMDFSRHCVAKGVVANLRALRGFASKALLGFALTFNMALANNDTTDNNSNQQQQQDFNKNELTKGAVDGEYIYILTADKTISGSIYGDGITKLTINAEGKTITLVPPQNSSRTELGSYDLSDQDTYYAFDVNANLKLNGTNNSNNKELKLNVGEAGVINGNLDITGKAAADGKTWLGVSQGRHPEGGQFNGSLSVSGDFSATNASLMFQNNSGGDINSKFQVGGKTTLSGVKVSLQETFENSSTTRYTLINSSGGFYKDASTALTSENISDASAANNTASVQLHASLDDLEARFNVTLLDADTQNSGYYTSADDTLLKPTLKIEDNSLVLEKEIGEYTLKDLQTNYLATIIALLDAFIPANAQNCDQENAQNCNHFSQAEIDRLKAFKTDLETRKTNLTNTTDADIARSWGLDGEILASALNSQQTKTFIGAALASDMFYGGSSFIEQIITDAQNSAQSASNTASVVSTINLANDMAITTRVANAHNPYSNLAALKGVKFANLDGDVPLYYLVNANYSSNIWANVIGGANIIDGETGGLYGVSVGFEQKGESALLGFYLSYANATLKYSNLEQKSNNFQVGIYNSLRLGLSNELNFKLYGQMSSTKDTSYLLNSEIKGDYTRDYLGFSANGGHVFSFSEDSFFIKPFLGANYYLTHTPGYDQSGVAAKSIDAITNHSLSLEIGGDFRKYLSQSSFFYVSPKIEQYVLNSGSDYVAGFLGSSTTFTIETERTKKTYAQLVLGGNFDITESFNLNFALGVKQILAGQVNSQNESYISGNLGVKYRF